MGPDLFKFDNSFSIFVEDDIVNYRSEVVNKLLNKRVIKKRRDYATKYLIK